LRRVAATAPAAPVVAATVPEWAAAARREQPPSAHRREHWAALAVLAAIVAVFFWPLFRGDTYVDVASRQNELYPWAGFHVDRPPTLHYDMADAYYPWQVFTNRAFRAGEIPLWNPYAFGGTPYEANGQNGIFYPPRTLLSLLVPPERVLDLLIVSHMLLGGLLMYLLLRAVRLGFAAALFGAVAWMLNSFMLAWMGLTHYVVVEAWLPLAVLLLLRLFRYRAWTDGVWLGVVLSLICLGGHIMYVLISITTCAALAAFLALRLAWREMRTRPPVEALARAVRANLVVAVPFVVMGGLIAVQVLPMLDLGRESARTALPYDQFIGSNYRIEAGQLLYLLLPPPGISRGLHVDAGWLFLGTPTALLALVGLLRRQPLAIFARWLALVALLVALGTLATWCLYYGLPGFKYFKPVSRVMFLFQFGIAILAAYGVDYLLRRAPRLRRWWARWSPGRRALVAYAALAIVVLQMFHLGDALVRHQPDTPDYLYPETPLTRLLGRGDGTRILPVIPDRTVQPDHPIGRFLYGSAAMVFPIESALGYDNPPDRIANLWRVVHGNTPERVLGPPTELDLLRPPDDKAQRIWAYVPTFRVPDVRFDLLPRVGVTDVLAPPYVERDPTWDPARFEPTRLELRYSGPDGRIYHVADALPRAYVVPTCVRPDSQLAVLDRFADPAWDPRRAVLLDPSQTPEGIGCAPLTETADPASAGSAEVISRSLNTLSVRVHAEQPGWLVVNESWDSGWVARVDGSPTTVYPGNYAFRTLQVPAGDHTVDLTYEPVSFRRGAIVSGLAVAFVLAVAAWSLLRAWRLGAMRVPALPAGASPLAGAAGRPRPALKRFSAQLRGALTAHPAAVGYGLLVLAVALYQQWLGARVAVAYFAGDTARHLDLAEALAVNLRPDLSTLASSASPAAVAAYGVLLRLFDVAFDRPGNGVLVPSLGPLVPALALLATLACLLAALTAYRFSGSHAVAVVTTLLLGVYPPLVVAAERGTAELLFILFFLGALLCGHEAFVGRSVGWGAATGLPFALTVGTHLDWQPILGALAAAFLALVTIRLLACGRRAALGVAGAVVMAGFGLLAVWAGVLAALPADQRPSSLDQPAARRSLFALSLTGGWAPDAWYALQAPPDAPSRAQSAAALLRGDPVCGGGAVWGTYLACGALQSPLTTARQVAVNQVRLWWYPYRAPAAEPGPQGDLLAGYHRLLLLLGLAGCLLLARRQPLAGIALALPALFVAAWYAVQMADPQAALVAMPSLAIGAAVALVAARAAITSTLRAPVPVASSAVGCALLGASLTFGLDSAATGPRDQWSARLTDSRQQLIQEIDRASPPAPNEHYAVLIDLQALDGDLSDLTVTLNGRAVPTVSTAGGLVFPTAAAMSVDAYRARYGQDPRGWSDVMRRPQWIALPVPSDWVQAGKNEVRVGLRPGAAPHAVAVFGESAPPDSALRLPTLFETSAARFDQDGDARVPAEMTLTSHGRTSWYSPDGGFSLLGDLSADPGPQAGTYHVFLAALEGEPLPDALGDREVSTRSVTARVEGADAGPVDTFWLLASDLGQSRVTIFNAGQALVAFRAGGDSPARWSSPNADVVYQPYDPADPPFPTTNFEFDQTRYEMTPLEAATTLWYRLAPGDRAPRPDTLPAPSSGVYVVHLREPVSPRRLTITAAAVDDTALVDWDAVGRWSAAKASTDQPVVLAASADGTKQHLSSLTQPTAAPPIAPTLFLVHGGDLVPDATVAAAAARLGVSTVPARLVPTAAPLSYPAVPTGDGGVFTTYWAGIDAADAVELPPAVVRLE
jgi:hypothetical protein